MLIMQQNKCKRTFLEFKSPATSYQDFKKAILRYYPDTAGDFIYFLQDMDILVGERLQNRIISPKDLLDYHMQFSAITTWLIEKGQLGHLEQQRAYCMSEHSSLNYSKLSWIDFSSNIKITTPALRTR